MLSTVLAQVTEGDVEVINVREVDERLGPLVFTLVGLGVFALAVTIVFWWMTRPARVDGRSK